MHMDTPPPSENLYNNFQGSRFFRAVRTRDELSLFIDIDYLIMKEIVFGYIIWGDDQDVEHCSFISHWDGLDESIKF